MKFAYRTQANAQAISKIYNKPLSKPEWFKVTAAATKEEESQVLIYDYIGWPFNDPIDLIHAISDMENVLVRINSPGGDVFDGMAIFNAFQSHQGGTVTTRIEGLAASMGSVIAMAGMAGKRVTAYDNTMIMIHNAWTVMAGNQFELRDTADLLEKIDSNILDIYQKKSKKGKKEISEMMKETTWMTAKEAKDQGFIDSIVDGKLIKAEFDLSIFPNAPENIAAVIPNTNNMTLTGFDVEKILREANVSKAFAKAVAAACRTAKLFDRSQSDDNVNSNVDNTEVLSALNDLMLKIKK